MRDYVQQSQREHDKHRDEHGEGVVLAELHPVGVHGPHLLIRLILVDESEAETEDQGEGSEDHENDCDVPGDGRVHVEEDELIRASIHDDHKMHQAHTS